jgi:plasmid stabilization system protein ParE
MDDNIVQRIVAARQTLDAATDELTTRLLTFEEDLAKLQLGVAAWYGTEPTKVGYRKLDGKWCVVVMFQEMPGGEAHVVAVRHASRTLRLFAYRHRNDLLHALEVTATRLTERMNKALHEIGDHPDDGSGCQGAPRVAKDVT